MQQIKYQFNLGFGFVYVLPTLTATARGAELQLTLKISFLQIHTAKMRICPLCCNLELLHEVFNPKYLDTFPRKPV